MSMIGWLGDETIRIWNSNTPNPVQVIPGGGAEILTCDWTKYDQVKFKKWKPKLIASILFISKSSGFTALAYVAARNVFLFGLWQ